MHKLAIVIIILTAIFFRTNNLEGKMTFEWDQERDMREVKAMVDNHQPALVGPIVRGEAGGFYLGPAYYYLVLPFYLISHGNPLSLSIISIGIDVVVAAILYLYLSTHVSKIIAFSISMLWAGSPLLISGAYTPWNVSLIHLWMLLYLWTLEQMLVTKKIRYRLLTLFLASLTTSIHVSVIPVAAALLAYNWRYFYRLTYQAYLWCIVAILTPVSTLIYFDLTHSFDNLRRLRRFFFGVGSNPTKLGEIIPLIGEKLSYTIARLFTGEPYTYLGVAILLMTAFIIWKYWHKLFMLRQYSIVIMTVIVALLIYRDPDFAEYYFLPVFIPLLLIIGHGLNAIPQKAKLILMGASSVFYFILGANYRSKAISPYSLTVKREVLSAIKSLEYPVEIRTRLPRERDTGFNYLAKDMGVISNPAAARKAYIYEASNMELVAPEEARSIILDKPIKAFKLIVFSN